MTRRKLFLSVNELPRSEEFNNTSGSCLSAAGVLTQADTQIWLFSLVSKTTDLGPLPHPSVSRDSRACLHIVSQAMRIICVHDTYLLKD